VDAFWNLSASIDVERLRVAADGVSTTLTSCHVEVCATPSDGGSSHVLSWTGSHSKQDLLPDQVIPEVDLSGVSAGIDLDGSDALGIHDGWAALLHAVPVGTAMTTGFREGTLLRRGDTEAGRAAMNVGVDVASVATLAKIGAALGLLAGPPGVVAGGVAGALLGKLTGARIKSRHLRKALKAHDAALKDHEAETHRVQAELATEWDAVVSDATARYRGELEAAKARQVQVAEGLELDLRRHASLSAAEAVRQLDAGAKRVDQLLRTAPSRRARTLLKSDARAWRAEARRLRKGWQADVQHTEALFDLLLALPGEAPGVHAHADQARSRRDAALSTLADAVRGLTDEFARLWKAAVDALDARLEALRGRMEKRLRDSADAVLATLAAVRVEARRAGHANV
jgi:hypothetical protein